MSLSHHLTTLIFAVLKFTTLTSAAILSPLNTSLLTSAPEYSPVLTASGRALAKRGLPYHNPPLYIANFNEPNSQVAWAYDWASKMDVAFPSYLEYVPMLWSGSAGRTQVWNANVGDASKRGTRTVLGFNEPDGCGDGQSCMSPQQAADVWLQYMEPVRKAYRVKLGGPAVTEGYSGTAWLRMFLSLCRGCTIDFMPVHIYSTVNDIGHYQRHIQDIRNVTGLPIWVTELHASGTQAEQITFIETLMPWLDAQTYVERYAWFLCSPTYTGGSLVGTDAKPSVLGKVYETSRLGHVGGD